MTCNRPKKLPLSSSTLFFKIILQQSLQDGKLKIPNKFTNKHGGNLPNPLFLKPPDDTKWEVHWSKHDGAIWLEKGWKDFATYYTLGHGHLIVFEYQETFHLEVHIFDTSCVEITYPFHDTQNDHDSFDYITNDTVKILDEVTPTQNNKLISPCKKLKTTTSGVVGSSSNLQQMTPCVQIQRTQGIKFQESTLASVGEVVDGNVTESQKMEQLTSKINAALNKAETFRSNNPSCTVVLKPSYVIGRSLNIPSKFAKRYLKEDPMDILLQSLDGRSWLVNYSRGKFYTGWSNFTLDNQLNVGDVCLLELIKSQELICLEVRILRLSNETHSPLSIVQGDGFNCIYPKRIPYFRSRTYIPKEGRWKETKTATQSSSPQSFTNGAMKEAKMFTSENPCFRFKIKSGPKRDYRPVVPIAFMRDYFSNKKTVMLQLGNKLWPVGLLRSMDVPTKLSKGWALFERESKLLVGDVCIFELINIEDAVFYVHIFRGQS